MKTTFYNFPEKMFVGSKIRTNEKYRLGFMTPFGTDATFTKRKETVVRWCGESRFNRTKDETIKYETIDNVPVEGFVFDKSVSRYSTDNKWFRLYDPRGFYVEITSANMATLVMNNDIKHGALQGKFFWGRLENVNYLMRADCQEYIEFNKELPELKIGDYIASKNTTGVYRGVYYVNAIDRNRTDAGSGYYNSVSIYSLQLKYNDKPYHVFTRRGVTYMFMRKLPKNYIIVQEPDDMAEQLTGIIPEGFEEDLHFFFASKENHEAFTLSIEEIQQKSDAAAAAYDLKYPQYSQGRNMREKVICTSNEKVMGQFPY